MPTMPCPSCGKTVRFEGVAGVCPNCAAVVRAPRSAPGGGPAVAKPRATGSEQRPASLSDLQAMGGEDEAFDPGVGRPSSYRGGGGGGGGGLSSLDPRLLYGIGTALVLIVGFGLYEVLHTPSATIVVSTAPPPPASGGPATPAVAPAVPVAPPPVVPPPVVAATEPGGRPTTLPSWVGLRPEVPVLPPEKINDGMVERSLRRGVAYLKPQVAEGGEISPGGGDAVGSESLVTYALLHAGRRSRTRTCRRRARSCPGPWTGSRPKSRVRRRRRTTTRCGPSAWRWPTGTWTGQR